MVTTAALHWPLSLVCGTLLTLLLFAALPWIRARQPERPVIFEVELQQWKTPVKTPPPKAVEKPPKPKRKSIPKPKQKPRLVKKPVLKKPHPKQVRQMEEPLEPAISKPVEPQSEPDEIPPEPDLTPVPLYKLSEPPRFLHQAQAVYPDSMRRLGREGVVVLRILIDKDGVVREVRVYKSAGEAFDQAAVSAIKQSRFNPAKAQGKPVVSSLQIPVRFRLQ